MHGTYNTVEAQSNSPLSVSTDIRPRPVPSTIQHGSDRAGQARSGGHHIRAAGDSGQLRHPGERYHRHTDAHCFQWCSLW